MIALTLGLTAPAQTKYSSRILLIPLDDRPPCLQFPLRMGAVGDAEIVTPPRELLGRFTDFGKSDEIIEWLKKQDLRSFDAAIVSVDMLAYGGLVAMRVHGTDDAAAMRRLDFVREMRRAAPRLKIYGSSVIMRLAPTGNVVNEAYREKLARWAEISVEPENRAETEKLEKAIPADALADYKAARARDLKINQASIEMVRDKIFDYLILSQDDAKPKGVHVADREKLIARMKALNLQNKIAVQPGADEVSMLLLARALTDKYDFRPKIRTVFSAENIADQFMPYEDRPLRQTVSFQIRSTGALEVPDYESADLRFLVFASRFDPESAGKFIERETRNLAAGGKILPAIIADIDPKGDVQGGDVRFTELALKSGWISPSTAGYAAWNTAGNTIGTALPQGVVYSSFRAMKALRKNAKAAENKARMRRTAEAQNWFTLHRLFDDYVYHSLIRPKALKLIRENKWNSLRLTDEQTATIEDFCLKELKSAAPAVAKKYFGALNERKCTVEGVTFDLPWNRTFEAEIDFRIVCENKI
jgi:hypothetical protein